MAKGIEEHRQTHQQWTAAWPWLLQLKDNLRPNWSTEEYNNTRSRTIAVKCGKPINGPQMIEFNNFCPLIFHLAPSSNQTFIILAKKVFTWRGTRRVGATLCYRCTWWGQISLNKDSQMQTQRFTFNACIWESNIFVNPSDARSTIHKYIPMYTWTNYDSYKCKRITTNILFNFFVDSYV